MTKFDAWTVANVAIGALAGIVGQIWGLPLLTLLSELLFAALVISLFGSAIYVLLRFARMYWRYEIRGRR